MIIKAVTREQFGLWKVFRQALYTDVDSRFHDEEMQWLFASDETGCFLVWSESGDAIGLLELTLRNFVDGCVGGPVGYIEGIYLIPEQRAQGHGKRMIEFAAEWSRQHGCKSMATDAEIPNTDAQQFYRNLGFNEGWRVVGFTKSLQEE